MSDPERPRTDGDDDSGQRSPWASSSSDSSLDDAQRPADGGAPAVSGSYPLGDPPPPAQTSAPDPGWSGYPAEQPPSPYAPPGPHQQPYGRPPEQPYGGPYPPQPPPPYEQSYAQPSAPNPYEQPYGQPYPGGGVSWSPYGQGPPPTHPQATTAMVLGIVSLVGLSVCIGGLIGIAGIVLGSKAKREIDADPTRFSGRGMASAGIITGWIGVGLALLGVLLFVVLLASGNFPES